MPAKTHRSIQPVPAGRIVSTPAGDIELPTRFIRLRVSQNGTAIAAEQYCHSGCGRILATALRQWQPNYADHNAKGDPIAPDLGPRHCALCGLSQK